MGLVAYILFSDSEQDSTVGIVLATLTILALVAWTIGLRMHGNRVLIRSGAFPNWCSGDFHPCDELELRQAVVAAKEQFDSLPFVVGSGWGFFLWRRGAPRPRIFTHHYSGLDGKRWRAGTTIHQVQKHLKTAGRSLSNHPTMDFISLGSWISCHNHGNAGDTSAVEPIKEVTLLDMQNNTTETLSLAAARLKMDKFNGRFAVLYVEIDSVPNETLQKRAIKINSPQAAADWLAPGAALRLLFLGAARSYAIGLRWEEPYDDSTHHDPHVCSRFCQFLQVDVCSAVGGWHEPLSRYNSKSTRVYANRWMPPIFPVMTLAVVLGGVMNFELFFKLDDVLTGITLHRLVEAAIAMHKKLGGRSEIRYGPPSSSTIVYWDISLSKGFEAPFRLVYDELGVERVALHPGKFHALETIPCRRVSPAAL